VRTFKLYPTEWRWWSFADYEGLLSIVERFKPRTVLEFGPGSSTLALVEGGARAVYTCEDDPNWTARNRQRFSTLPMGVGIYEYTWSDPITVPALDAMTFDLGFVDGPRETPKRPPVMRYVVEHCKVAVLPAEERMDRAYLVPHIEALAREYNKSLEWVEVGPLTYAMAILC